MKKDKKRKVEDKIFDKAHKKAGKKLSKALKPDRHGHIDTTKTTPEAYIKNVDEITKHLTKKKKKKNKRAGTGNHPLSR